MMRNITPEQIEKIKGCNTAEECLTMAKAEGFEITSEQAEEFLKMIFLPNGEISDEQLDNVAGGSCVVAPTKPTTTCPDCARGNCSTHGAPRFKFSNPFKK